LRSAVIPARGGSQRIKGKNIRTFSGSPIISWPITASLETGLFDDVFVSTDNQEIADISQKLGATILWRPENLADNFTGTTKVIQNAIGTTLAHLSSDHWIYKIYPTSPITPDLVRDFIKFTEKSPEQFSISVGKFRNNIERAMGLNDSGELYPLSPEYLNSRSQDLEERFFDAGKIYGATIGAWKATNSPLSQGARGFMLPIWASIDIDTEDDWVLAELCFTHLRNSYRSEAQPN
jgi:N-acylneuraminate cytidylyltransferase